MIWQVREKLTYANVMSTLAVFLVLGGGITAAAISGSGSVKFGGQKGVSPAPSWDTILNLSGIGKVQAQCGKGTNIAFRNTSGKKLLATFLENEGGGAQDALLDDKDRLQETFEPADNGIDTIRFHVATLNGKVMAEITASNRYPDDFACAKRTVAAQAVSSE